MRRPLTFVLLFVFVLLLSACQSQALEEPTPTSAANEELTDSPMTSTSPALSTEAEET